MRINIPYYVSGRRGCASARRGKVRLITKTMFRASRNRPPGQQALTSQFFLFQWYTGQLLHASSLHCKRFEPHKAMPRVISHITLFSNRRVCLATIKFWPSMASHRGWSANWNHRYHWWKRRSDAALPYVSMWCIHSRCRRVVSSDA